MNRRRSSILPTDESIFERSKLWATFFSRLAEEEDYEEMDFDEIPDDDEDSDQEVSDKSPVNNCRALMRVNNFEGSSSSDELDVEDLINETRPDVEERKRIWKESGMDKVLDTFDLNAITTKVGSWLKNTGQSKRKAVNSAFEHARIVHYENHNLNFSSDDSMQSADTAKYILSNRKPRTGSCTTMTIKRFRFGTGKQQQLLRDFDCLNEIDIDQLLNKRRAGYITPSTRPRTRCTSEVMRREKCDRGFTPTTERKSYKNNLGDSFNKTGPKSKKETIQTLRSRNRKRRSDTRRKRSGSSSSSSTSACSCNCINSKFKFRRGRRKYKETDGSYQCVDCEPVEKRTFRSLRSSNRQECLNKSPTKFNEVQIAQSSDIGFLPEDIVNSTAVNHSGNGIPTTKKNCQLSPITEKNVLKDSTKSPTGSKKLDIQLTACKAMAKPQANEKPIDKKLKEVAKTTRFSEVQNVDGKILIYSPEYCTMFQETICDGSFKLTEEHLRNSIGEKAARRFITLNAKKFPWKFDSSSTVYFKLPADSKDSETDSSDEDVLDMFGKQGELIEQPKFK